MGYGRCNGCGRPDLLMDGLCYWCERAATIFHNYERDDNGESKALDSEQAAPASEQKSQPDGRVGRG